MPAVVRRLLRPLLENKLVSTIVTGIVVVVAGTVILESGVITKEPRVEPQVDIIVPKEVSAGVEVDITGKNLELVRKVYLLKAGKKIPIPFTVASQTHLTMVVPGHVETGEYPLEFWLADGRPFSTGKTIIVIVPETARVLVSQPVKVREPEVSGVSPKVVSGGMSADIWGRNLDLVEEVAFTAPGLYYRIGRRVIEPTHLVITIANVVPRGLYPIRLILEGRKPKDTNLTIEVVED